MTSTIKVNSIELPEDDTYRLVKLEGTGVPIKLGGIFVGATYEGSLYPNTLVIGQRVMLGGLYGVSTNVLTKIELTDDPLVIMLTTASDSIYELTNIGKN